MHANDWCHDNTEDNKIFDVSKEECLAHCESIDSIKCCGWRTDEGGSCMALTRKASHTDWADHPYGRHPFQNGFWAAACDNTEPGPAGWH